MANLSMVDKRLLEELFGMAGGYVLDFSNNTFAEFFNQHGIEIYLDKYATFGDSKAKRLRRFWQIESDTLVAKILKSLFEYVEVINPEEAGELTKHQWQIVSKLQGISSAQPTSTDTESSFLSQNYESPSISKLNLDSVTEQVLKQRLDEIQVCLKSGAWLSVVFLIGSSLEAILLYTAIVNPKKFNTSSSAPKQDGKVKQFHNWSLAELINVAHAESFISMNIKKFGHAVRDFRNFIHPNQQIIARFDPDEHTAKISWQVLCATISDLTS
jgi:hypothetical protein